MIERNEGFSNLVILGAGATFAAFPNGDTNGTPIPIMKDFMKNTGLYEKFPEYKNDIDNYSNLEDLYTYWHDTESKQEACSRLENELWNYMSQLDAGTTPNQYTALLLSLTSRDCIATFNWDPLLPQTYKLLSFATHDLPHVLFLHGNTGMGTCMDCEAIGYYGANCRVCGKPFEKMELLYPIKKKDYNKSPYIASAWSDLEKVIENAQFITIFGYSAPKSDVEARAMLLNAFNKSPNLEFKQIEIIDITPEEEVRENYKDFIYKNSRLTVWDSFYKTQLARYPRRAAEVFYSCTMQCKPIDLRDPSGAKIQFTEDDGYRNLFQKINYIDNNALFPNIKDRFNLS